MKKLIKAFLCLLLGFLMTLPLLVSCAKDNQGTDTTVPDTTVGNVDEVTTAPETSEEDYRNSISDDLPALKYDNQYFDILIRSDYKYEFMSDGTTGDPINDAVYKRNSAIEERFGVRLRIKDIAGTWADRVAFRTAITAEVNSNESQYDLIYTAQAYIITTILAGELLNYSDLPNINLEKPWWSDSFNDEASLYGKTYIATGDSSISLWNNMYGMVFNKQLAQTYALPDLYKLVNDGDWTLDKLTELTKDISVDKNGDGFGDDDFYGFVTSPANHLRAFNVALNCPLVELGSDDKYVATYNTERTFNAIDKLITLVHDNNSYYKNTQLQTPVAEGVPVMFSENRALFMTVYLGNVQLLRSMETNFGILPYPKFDTEQLSYYTVSGSGLSVSCFPTSIPNTELSGIITEAMCAYGYKDVIPQYYETVIKSKTARDEESMLMLDIMRETLTFDVGWIYSSNIGGSIATMSETIVKNGVNTFYSAYKANSSTIDTGLANVLTKYQALE